MINKKGKIMRLWLFGCFLFTVFFSFSQNQFNQWRFGANAGIDFNGPLPVSVPGSSLNTNEGCSSVADKYGNLLFYTDGNKVWGRNHVQMPNGHSLNALGGSTSQTLVVKQPGSCDLYYVFTMPSNGCISDTTDGLRYSIVDLSQNGGMGDVTTKNVLLLPRVAEKVTATLHGNGCDVWILAHEMESDKFVAYLLTASGLNTTPVVTNVGIVHYEGLVGMGAVGQMKISPDGRKLALATYINNIPTHTNFCEILDFNNLTGALSNPITLNQDKYASAYGIEFSPNSNFLYVAGEASKKIYQLDLLAGPPAAVIASSVLIDSAHASSIGALQLAPDGKIYLAKHDSTHLGVINNPNLAGTACNYVDNGFALTSGRCRIGLPSAIINTYDCSRPEITNLPTYCENENAVFSIYDTSGTTITGIKWTFGNPVSGTADTSLLPAPSHTYSLSGTYTVTAIVSYNCKNDTVISTLTVTPGPVVNITSTVDVCPGDSATLSASGAATYVWSPSTGLSSTNTPVVIVTPSSTTVYTLTATGSSGCISVNTATVNILPLPLGITTPTVSYCDGATGLISAAGGGTYSWSPSTGLSSTSTASVTASSTLNTVYTVTVVSTQGCIKIDSAAVSVLPVPVLFVTGEDSVCPDGMASISAAGAQSYLWSNASSDSVISAVTGTYTVTGTAVNGCTSTATHVVSSYNIIVVNAGPDVEITAGASTTLSASGGGTYHWSPASALSCITCTNPIANPSQTTTYYVLQTDANGCTSQDSIIVKVLNVCNDLFIPNAFSPNADGANDVFMVYGNCIAGINLIIYNRWGEIVVELKDISQYWDGTHKGNILNTDVFYYQATVISDKGDEQTLSGNIHLVK